MDLVASQERSWPGRPKDGRGLLLGGIFSGLARRPSDPESVFYCVTDRGPNDEVTIGSERRRTFPMPEYAPLIFRISAAAGRLRILDEIGLRTSRGRPVSGLPNTEDDEVPYGYDGRGRLALDPNGLDVEGLAIARDGSFWIADEYRPSLAHVAADGRLRIRLIPRGVKLRADVRFEAVLPSIYARHRANRGFESVALSPDGARLVAILESPLEFPDRTASRQSRMLRMLVVDPIRRVPEAEHVYVMEDAEEFEASQDEMRVSDVTFVDRTRLLVVERSAEVTRIYQIDLAGATNVLNGRWSNPKHPERALEIVKPTDLRKAGIVPVSKVLLVDLARFKNIPRKIEGLAIVNPTTIAIGNDNDFGFSGFDGRGRAILSGTPSVLTFIRLPQPLLSEP